MSELALQTPTHQAIHAKTRSAPGRVTGKLALAIKRMIELGDDYVKAGENVGLTARAMYIALHKPHVIEYIKRERHVFRAAINTKNIIRLAQIRDAADNMPAVNAIKELEAMETTAIAQSGIKQTAGVVIQIVTPGVTQSSAAVVNALDHTAITDQHVTSNHVPDADRPSSNPADETGVGEK